LDLTKRGLRELKRLSKGYENGQELATLESGGWSDFYREYEKLAVRVVRPDRSNRSTIPVRPVG
jgi:hypothetical protein